jgi:4-amino-4-deoxy-L-arabinose transferase-like glycosyltransferase
LIKNLQKIALSPGDIAPYLIIMAVHVAGLPVDVLGVDAPQYAAMTREMLETGNFLQITDRYQDYLDKPPFLFWINALSYLIFGINNFAYKLPSFLFSILGIFSIYRLSKIFYSPFASRLAALFAASSQAWFLMTNDVRTDTVLTACIAFSTWQLFEYLECGKTSGFWWGFVGIAMAMLTKGPMGLMSPLCALASHIVITKKWNWIFKWQWLLGVIFVLILLSPMLYGLYQQFDLHPEKLVNHKTGNSGIKFYFWEQSFGRLTGDNTQWRDADAGTWPHRLFFVHTFLWMFFPWALLAIGGIWQKLKEFFYALFAAKPSGEFFTIGATFIPFLAISVSQYKLPHYIYVILPFTAILAAVFAEKIILKQKESKFWFAIQQFQNVLIWVVLFTIVFYVFTENVFLFGILSILLFVGYIWILKQKTFPANRLILSSLYSVLALNFMLNIHFFPRLLSYQCYNEVGRIVLKEKVPIGKFFKMGDGAHALDFYAQQVVQSVPAMNELKQIANGNTVWIFCTEKSLALLQTEKLPIQQIQTFDFYPISLMSLDFLIPEVRSNIVEKRYLVTLQNKN